MVSTVTGIAKSPDLLRALSSAGSCSRNIPHHRGSRRSSAPTARAKSQACTTTSCVSRGMSLAASNCLGDIVADRRHLDDPFEQTVTPQHFANSIEGQLPTPLRIVTGPVGFEPQRAQQQHIVEADHMLEHTSGVPSLTRRATIPSSVRRPDRLTEPPAHRQVQLGRTTTAHWAIMPRRHGRSGVSSYVGPGQSLHTVAVNTSQRPASRTVSGPPPSHVVAPAANAAPPPHAPAITELTQRRLHAHKTGHSVIDIRPKPTRISRIRRNRICGITGKAREALPHKQLLRSITPPVLLTGQSSKHLAQRGTRAGCPWYGRHRDWIVQIAHGALAAWLFDLAFVIAAVIVLAS
jgi:hypothetical protein